MFQETLDWAWWYANIAHQGDPWIRTGLRSAMVGAVFVVNGEAHAVVIIGFQRFAFERGGGVLVLGGLRIQLPIILTEELRGTLEESDAERKKNKRKGHGQTPARATS